ncbi:MAG: beta/gamma crystallin family protein [Proteobacteria bacterium]|nr:beta/gamma crystallin family protein [Pseudomonadota bacterium]
MNPWSKLGAMTALAVAAGHACADVTFYEQENFQGRAYIAQGSVPDLARLGFRDRVASVVVSGTPWEVCDDRSFAGQCMILRPGSYPSLRAMSLNDRVASARQVESDRHYEASRYAPTPPAPTGQVTFYSRPGFDGRSFASDGDVADLARFGFNDRATSIIVRGSERWEVCEDANFSGRCAVLGPGSYRDLSAMGLSHSVSSVRLAEPGAQTAQAYVPPPRTYESRSDQPLYQVDVDRVHAVYATTDQRCWVERNQVVQDGTAAVADGQVVRTPPTISTQDVRHCDRLPRSGQPDYWDVTYYFHGTEHHVELTAPPGPTITVDGMGDPRM